VGNAWNVAKSESSQKCAELIWQAGSNPATCIGKFFKFNGGDGDMTAMEVYWVMQLDTIRFGANTILFVIGMVSAFVLIIGITGSTAPNDTLFPRAAAVKCVRSGVYGAAVSFVIGVLVIFIPSSRTVAAMYILPAIVNSEDVQLEMKEIYDLAKDGLKSLVKPESE
jgi:hypothetical protein